MTAPVTLNPSSNCSYYDPTDNMSHANGSNAGAGGAGGSTGAGGSEGAGNVDKREEAPGSLRCLPEAMAVVRECGATLLVKSFPSSVLCGMSLGALGECLGLSE